MEEQVGQLWHRFVTRLADSRHLQAAVQLQDIKQPLSVFYRALGGDPGLQIQVADRKAISIRRSLLQKIAGNQRHAELAWLDDSSLRLPAQLAWFPTAALNRDLYFWLAGLAGSPVSGHQHWLLQNQQATVTTLQRFPGLRQRYQRLLEAHLLQRPPFDSLPAEEQPREQLIRQALSDPGSIQDIAAARRNSKYQPYPVPLWLQPAPETSGNSIWTNDDDGQQQDNEKSHTREVENIGKRQAEQVETPEENRGLITIRMENILTIGEFINLDRGSEEEDDLEQAETIARDLDKLSVTRNNKSIGSRLKFDLDLPAQSEDDIILNDGYLLPEWDFKRQQLIPNCCRIVEMLSRDAPAIDLPENLRRTARRLRRQFQAVAPARSWLSRQTDGQEIDLDAWLRYLTDRQSGHQASADALYRELHTDRRDLACLLLADLSLSTDSWINDEHRVIDVIRDSLFLFAESMAATGDPFAMYGFSSRKRDPIRIHRLKAFDESFSAKIRGRIATIKPGYYTRMGAAIRFGTDKLQQQPAAHRLLLILSDGKPNDLDKYEGRFGIEDTRQAIIDARRAGLEPFCVTIDSKANDYLPHLFGKRGYVVIRKPSELPQKLPTLYARLTIKH